MINPVQSSISIPTEHHFQACQIKLTRGMKSRASVCVCMVYSDSVWQHAGRRSGMVHLRAARWIDIFSRGKLQRMLCHCEQRVQTVCYDIS